MQACTETLELVQGSIKERLMARLHWRYNPASFPQ
jgi:hypothetical protein